MQYRSLFQKKSLSGWLVAKDQSIRMMSMKWWVWKRIYWWIINDKKDCLIEKDSETFENYQLYLIAFNSQKKCQKFWNVTKLLRQRVVLNMYLASFIMIQLSLESESFIVWL